MRHTILKNYAWIKRFVRRHGGAYFKPWVLSKAAWLTPEEVAFTLTRKGVVRQFDYERSIRLVARKVPACGGRGHFNLQHGETCSLCGKTVTRDLVFGREEYQQPPEVSCEV